MSLETVTINGDIVKSSFTSKTASGIGDTNGGSSTINGDIKDCTISGKVYGLQLRGSVKNIIGCTISADYVPASPNISPQIGYALKIYGKVEGKVENTTMTGKNNALPFMFSIYYPYPDGEEFVKSTVTLKDCTFEDADADGYKVNNKGFSMDIGGSGYENGDSGTYYANDYWFASDATINIERVSPMSEEFNLGCDADDWDNKYTNNPLAKKLTLQSDESIEGGVTLTRAEDYKGQMFHVQNGTLELKDITLRGNSDAQDTMIYVSNYGSEYCLIVGDGAVLTGNTNTSSSGGAIRCKGDLVIDGGTISNNSARQSGGGVDFSGIGTLTINGGTITGNSCANGASGNGGGVYISGSATAVKMSGSPVITGNTKAGKANNLHIHNTPSEFTGELGENAEIGVITFNKPAESSPVQISTAESSTTYYPDALKYFSSDDEDYGVSANTTGHYLQLAIGFKVTVNDTELTDKAYPSSDFTYTIPDYEANSSYDVTVTIGGTEYEDFTIDDDKLTIPGEDISGDIEISYTQSITLTLDPDGGTLDEGDETVSVTLGGDAVYPTLPTPVRPGYTFEGWFTDGGTKIEAGGKVELTEDTTLYAFWVENVLTFTWMGNGYSVRAGARANLVPSITIPAQYEGGTVTQIASSAFANLTSLTSVDIPDTDEFILVIVFIDDFIPGIASQVLKISLEGVEWPGFFPRIDQCSQMSRLHFTILFPRPDIQTVV